MIKMIAGVYGLPVKQANGKTRVIAKGPESGPFSVDPEREAELVAKKLAVYVGEPQNDDVDPNGEDGQPYTGEPIGFDEVPELPEGVTAIPEYNADMKADELREIGKMCGLTFKVGMTKVEMVAALDEYIEANTVEDDELTTFDDEDEQAPDFDPTQAVQ